MVKDKCKFCDKITGCYFYIDKQMIHACIRCMKEYFLKQAQEEQKK